MSRTSHCPSVSTVGALISRRDYPHRLAVVVAYSRPDLTQTTEGLSVAVVAPATGEVLAWDGVYWMDEEQSVPEDVRRDLLDYDWEDLDDMPSKQLLKANGFWFSRIADMLQPTYSFDAMAATTLDSWFEDPNEDRLPQHVVVAYFPCDADNVVRQLERAMKDTAKSRRDEIVRQLSELPLPD